MMKSSSTECVCSSNPINSKTLSNRRCPSLFKVRFFKLFRMLNQASCELTWSFWLQKQSIVLLILLALVLPFLPKILVKWIGRKTRRERKPALIRLFSGSQRRLINWEDLQTVVWLKYIAIQASNNCSTRTAVTLWLSILELPGIQSWFGTLSKSKSAVLLPIGDCFCTLRLFSHGFLADPSYPSIKKTLGLLLVLKIKHHSNSEQKQTTKAAKKLSRPGMLLNSLETSKQAEGGPIKDLQPALKCKTIYDCFE